MNTIKHQKTIKLFLLDADPDGRIICELSNWSGKAYRIPRGKVKDCVDRPELKSTAVYMLFGGAESSSTQPKAYIGETENVYERLGTHVKKKDFWNEAVVFISKDENLNKAHIKYIESRLYELACDAGRYDIDNGTTPTKSSISESDQAEMEEFIEYIRLLLNTLNFKLFEPLVKVCESSDVEEEQLYIKATRGADAIGKRTKDGFVVRKGSLIATETVPSFPKSVNLQRSELIESGIIESKNDNMIFTDDYLFSSPSAAAMVVMGRSANGIVEWKNANGKVLADIESDEIDNAKGS